MDTASLAPYVYGVSCPSVSLCVAVDYSGNVLTSTHATAGARAWTITHVAGAGSFNAVSCPSASFCAAVDNEGDVATSGNPTGRSGGWNEEHIDNATVPCVGMQPGPCQAALQGVSCPSPHLCVAVDDAGNVLTSTNPTATSSAWTIANVGPAEEQPYPGGIYAGISCPSTSFCAVAELDGEVVTSTNPTGGPPAWIKTTGLDDSHDLTPISCPSASFCAIGDDAGNVLTSTDPTAGASAWTTTHVHGEIGFQGLACPSALLCVGVDGFGNAALGVSTPTSAQIKALLRTQLSLRGKMIRPQSLVRNDGYSITPTALTAGRLTISWHLMPHGPLRGPRKPNPVLVAVGSRTFTQPGAATLKIKLTHAGKQLLRHGNDFNLTAKASFKPAGKPTVFATTTIALKR